MFIMRRKRIGRKKLRNLVTGDRNTSFFHGSVKKRRVQNKFFSLLDEHGVEQFSEESKGNIAVEYFQRLFSTSNPNTGVRVLSGLSPRV